MKRGLVIILCLVLISFVSAGWWSDTYTKITGKTITGEVSEVGCCVGLPTDNCCTIPECVGPNGEIYDSDDSRCRIVSSSSSSGGATGSAYLPPHLRDPNLICTTTTVYVAVGSGPVKETSCHKEVSYTPAATPQTPDVCKEIMGKRKFCKPQRLIMSSKPTPVSYYTECSIKPTYCKSYYTTINTSSCITNPIDCSNSKYDSCSKCASCAEQPKIENAEFNIGEPKIKNQPWYKMAEDSPEKLACSWNCKEGYEAKIEETADGKKYICVEKKYECKYQENGVLINKVDNTKCIVEESSKEGGCCSGTCVSLQTDFNCGVCNKECISTGKMCKLSRLTQNYYDCSPCESNSECLQGFICSFHTGAGYNVCTLPSLPNKGETWELDFDYFDAGTIDRIKNSVEWTMKKYKDSMTVFGGEISIDPVNKKAKIKWEY